MFRLVLPLILALVTVPLTAEGQPAGKVPRIGMINQFYPPVFSPESDPFDRAFAEGLRDLGYVVGQNIAIEIRSAAGKAERVPELAAELVKLKVDLFFLTGDQKILAVKQVTSTVPIVMVACDAVDAGLITSLARPGGNITGLTCISGDLAAKRLELLRQAVPRLSRLAVLHNPSDPHAGLEVRQAYALGRIWGIRVLSLEVRAPNDLEDRFSAMTRERADMLFVVGDNLTISLAKRIVDLAARTGLPTVYAYREFVDVGGLMAYGPSLPEMARRAATYVDRILKGAKPGDLPVEQPTKYELVINLKTAKALGLTIPPSLLLRADEVISIVSESAEAREWAQSVYFRETC